MSEETLTIKVTLDQIVIAAKITAIEARLDAIERTIYSKGECPPNVPNFDRPNYALYTPRTEVKQVSEEIVTEDGKMIELPVRIESDDEHPDMGSTWNMYDSDERLIATFGWITDAEEVKKLLNREFIK